MYVRENNLDFGPNRQKSDSGARRLFGSRACCSSAVAPQVSGNFVRSVFAFRICGPGRALVTSPVLPKISKSYHGGI